MKARVVAAIARVVVRFAATVLVTEAVWRWSPVLDAQESRALLALFVGLEVAGGVVTRVGPWAEWEGE